MKPVIQLPLPNVPPPAEPTADAELREMFQRAREAFMRWRFRPEAEEPRRAAWAA